MFIYHVQCIRNAEHDLLILEFYSQQNAGDAS